MNSPACFWFHQDPHSDRRFLATACEISMFQTILSKPATQLPQWATVSSFQRRISDFQRPGKMRHGRKWHWKKTCEPTLCKMRLLYSYEDKQPMCNPYMLPVYCPVSIFGISLMLLPEQRQDVRGVSGRKTARQAVCHYSDLFMHFSSAKFNSVHFDLHLTTRQEEVPTKLPVHRSGKVWPKHQKSPTKPNPPPKLKLTVLTFFFFFF